MNSRLILSLLCAGALAFACGPRLRTLDPTALASTFPVALASPVVTTPPPHRAKSRAHSDNRVDAHLLVKVAKRTATFALQVKNVAGKHLELTFPNGRAYDFAVLDSSGREVWRWSTGRMFTQGIQNRLLGDGESMNVDATWTAKSAPGRYTVVATLNSSNFPTEARSEFVLP